MSNKRTTTTTLEDEAALSISPEKVCFIIIKAREFDAKDEDLLGMPLMGDFLEEGLSMLGHSCEEFEMGRL